MVTILGNGAWGQALASLLKENQQEFIFWDRVSPIDPSGIVLISTPAQVIRDLLTSHKESLKNTTIINTSKGIEKSTHLLPFQIAREILGLDVKYFSLMGPSFASEVVLKMPTMVSLGTFGNRALGNKIENIFQTDFFRIQQSDSNEAIELCGAFKNIYAVGCGIAEGLGFLGNTRAKLIALAYLEIANLCQKLNYKIDDDAGAGTIGDLVLTCSSTDSRNFRFGKLLAGMKISDALEQINKTVEGYGNVFSVPYFSHKTGLRMPVANFIYKTVLNDSPDLVEERFRSFIKKI